MGIDSYRHLGYDDGKTDAREDIKSFGINRAKVISKSLETNPAFSATYVTGYQNTISAHKGKK